MVVEVSKLNVAVCPGTRVSVEGTAGELGPPAIAGSTLPLRLTVPAKPPTLSTLITETAFTPGFTHKLDGVDVSEKSGTCAWTARPSANALTMIRMVAARMTDVWDLFLCIDDEI